MDQTSVCAQQNQQKNAIILPVFVEKCKETNLESETRRRAAFIHWYREEKTHEKQRRCYLGEIEMRCARGETKTKWMNSTKTKHHAYTPARRGLFLNFQSEIDFD